MAAYLFGALVSMISSSIAVVHSSSCLAHTAVHLHPQYHMKYCLYFIVYVSYLQVPAHAALCCRVSVAVPLTFNSTIQASLTLCELIISNNELGT
jgi:hypothetical protein